MFENVAKIIELNINELKKSRQTLKEIMDYLDDKEGGGNE